MGVVLISEFSVSSLFLSALVQLEGMGSGEESSSASILLHHSEPLEEDDSDIEEMFTLISSPEMAMGYVFSQKEEGNSLFKRKEFGNALAKYNKAIKCFCVIIVM